MALFDAAALRQAPYRREWAPTYAAVEYLRSIGCRVHRAGRDHRVDGRLVTSAELTRLAQNGGR